MSIISKAVSKTLSLFGYEKKKQRGFADIVGLGSSNTDWVLQSISADADLWQNAFALTARCRDLFKTNPIFIKYRELLLANVFGEKGIMTRMKIKEEQDRVVYSEDEKAVLVMHESRINRIREWAARKNGTEVQRYRAFRLADALETRSLESVLRGTATLEVGAPDVFANLLIERKFKEWMRPEFCDVRGTRDYHTLCGLRLISAVRDGDMFIRLIKDSRVNKFGFAIQYIQAEWCDRFLNETLSNGNVIIMGIEYEATTWGIGKPVAYYFIKRQPRDWQTQRMMWGHYNGDLHMHNRVPANEIIHYARPVEAEATRPAPWIAATIPSARQIDQYVIAAVIAARGAACKTGWLYSDIQPEGGTLGDLPDPTGSDGMKIEPGGIYGLPFGVKFQESDPKHPTTTFPAFKESAGQFMCAGLPGGDYNILFNDLKNINFSAGKLGRLDTNEMSMLLQRFEIGVAYNPIFEAFLEQGLIMGEIPLPSKKFSKFNKPEHQGRRWKQVDEVKDVTAAALRIANGMSNLNIECAESGLDFEEVAIERAEELMLLDEFGVPSLLTVQTNVAPAEDPKEEDGEPIAPTKSRLNGVHA